MYLKRMELFGFKSFAEKSELSFGPGIAAVIGPNGCGKSNIVDAVRWALGEQSVKSLRGTKMEEVIFSGSESRKALNFAEVSLTFEGACEFLNLDYNEITITRRLFRNGDSEYYINKSPCRLKDITELFLDTGLGKDIYSIIGQGRVDEII
ncbi:MAG: AAA family ATPase, partial [Dethiobacteria bacterium]|nr:AAA family ATPase [Dethiobacteria bacterium]